MTSEQHSLYILTAEQLRRTMGLLPEDEDPPEVEAAVIKHHYGDAAALDDARFEALMKACGLVKSQ
jgi:hypothetical protein